MDEDEIDNYKIVARVGEVSTTSSPSIFLQGDPNDGIDNADIISIGKIGFKSKNIISNPTKPVSAVNTNDSKIDAIPVNKTPLVTPLVTPVVSSAINKKQKRQSLKSNLDISELNTQINQSVTSALSELLPYLFNQAYQSFSDNLINKLKSDDSKKRDSELIDEEVLDQHTRKAKIIIHEGALTFDFDYISMNIFDDFIIISLPDSDDSFGLKFTDTQDLALQYCNDQSNTVTQKGIFIGNPFKPTSNSKCKLLIFLKDSDNQ